ncbi:hypothetical protein PCANB_003060 [Pneumocystis canis]|nr:hypothetical protein PCANB_003060 [Pneumocystis canis]
MKAFHIVLTLVLFSVAWANMQPRGLFSGWFGSNSDSNSDSKSGSKSSNTPSGSNLPPVPDIKPTPGGDLGPNLPLNPVSDSLRNSNLDPVKDSKQGKLSKSHVVKLPDGSTKTTVGDTVVKTTIVMSYTTSIPWPTVFVQNKKTYTVPEPTVLTVTDCPCTLTSTFFTTTQTKCVCTTEVVNLQVIPTNDMPIVNAAPRIGLGSFITCFAFILEFWTAFVSIL